MPQCTVPAWDEIPEEKTCRDEIFLQELMSPHVGHWDGEIHPRWMFVRELTVLVGGLWATGGGAEDLICSFAFFVRALLHRVRGLNCKWGTWLDPALCSKCPDLHCLALLYSFSLTIHKMKQRFCSFAFLVRPSCLVLKISWPPVFLLDSLIFLGIWSPQIPTALLSLVVSKL